MISIQNISKSFRETIAVDDLSLEVGRGEVLGFLGPNGAGKTTTMRMITGFLAPDNGTILIDGTDVQEHDLSVKHRIGYLPENNPIYREMLVGEYLNMVADIRRLAGEAREQAFDRTVRETGIADVYYRPIGELSKGFRQRTGLAAAILHEPDILILDEPTEGLDPNQRVEIRDLIRRLGEDRTVILSTHVLQEVRSTCNRVAIIDEGSLVADGTIEELMAQSQGHRHIVVEAEGKKLGEDLAELPGVQAVELEAEIDGRTRWVASAAGEEDLRPLIFDLAKKNRWRLYELFQREVDLEDVFRHLTTREAEEEGEEVAESDEEAESDEDA